MHNENQTTQGGIEEIREQLTRQLREENLHRVSPAQQRLWFLDQLEPNTPLYNIPSVARLSGKLDVPALQQSLDIIVARHESLRTRFISEDGEPMQVVDQEAGLEIQQHDLSGMPESERESAMQKLVRAEVKRPFKLSDERLVRADLLRLGPEEHVLVINMHHIVSDEWSLKVFFHELEKVYAARLNGGTPDLPELPIQYSDYAAWQREWLAGDEYQKQLTYWKEQLRGNPSGVDLPTDHPRPSRHTSHGAILLRALSPDLSDGLKQLAHQEEATLFMVLLAAFKSLLFRYTQQEDVVVGSPMAARNRVETEDLIGFFVNTLPLRTRVSAEMTFQELLKQVKEVALGAYSHQEIPFEKLVETLQPERSLSHTPFVKVLFLTQTKTDEVKLPGLRVKFLDMVTDTAKFDLSLGVQELGAILRTEIEYNSDLFEPATIERFLQHYECLLQGIVAQPAQRISELPLLSQAERLQLVGEWNPPPAEFPMGECLHQWFETQVERSPDAIALVCEERSLTYRELNAQANQLAHYLKPSGIGPDVPVALLLERSLKMVVAVLAVLKAGGAYVPMDPTWPKERLEFMLQDTLAPVVITQENLRSNIPQTDARVVALDVEAGLIERESTANLPNANASENVAYIIYTSGSTGKPKGVLVTHLNVARLMKQTEHWYGFDANDVWTLFHSYTFDFSVWEMYGALLYGGRLVIVPYLTTRSPAEFYSLLAREKVTVLNQTPSAFRQLLWAEDTAPAPLPLQLRYIIFGGEALELQSLKPWFERHGDERPLLVNMYGITETTVHVTYRVIRQADLNNGVGSVIGVPIPDLRIYLLDQKMQPVPVGVTGEIWVLGDGVARGYLNRPELSRQRFVTDPFSSRPGGRLYRSGDLARYTTNGELEYLGRMDHQVKIRGFRVELGEIESALNTHSAIRESVVIAADGPGGSKRLVAYIVPDGNPPTNAELRQYLGQKLPDHMVPSAFVQLDTLPLTSNGKVDRRALPAPDHDESAPGQNCVSPRNPIETKLVDIWCQLLRRKTVSIHENFFHLGGHSLLATQTIWRIGQAFNVDLPVRAIFEASTVAELAKVVSKASPASSGAITRRTGTGPSSKLLERLGKLSDSELQTLLRRSNDSAS